MKKKKKILGTVQNNIYVLIWSQPLTSPYLSTDTRASAELNCLFKHDCQTNSDQLCNLFFHKNNLGKIFL